MSVQIRRLQANEIPAHVVLVRTSLYAANDDNNRIMYPHGPTPALVAWQQERFSKLFADTVDDNSIFLGAFPATPSPATDMLSTAFWKLESGATFNPALETWEPVIPEGAQPVLPPSSPHVSMYEARPPDSNPAAIAYFMKRMDALRQRLMGRSEPYWHLMLLATGPEQQRRGAGTALLEWGLRRADGEGRRVYLDGTEMGRPFYERFGFRVLDHIEMVAGQWGDQSGRVGYTYAMVREVGGVVGSE